MAADLERVAASAGAEGASHSGCRMPFPLLFGARLASDRAVGTTAFAGAAGSETSNSSSEAADASAGALTVYASLGFQSSVAGTWSPQALHFYAAAAASGRALKSSGGMDVHQMGGDILVDAEGRVLAAHYSATSTDRPSVEALLEVARAASSVSSSASRAAAACESHAAAATTETITTAAAAPDRHTAAEFGPAVEAGSSKGHR